MEVERDHNTPLKGEFKILVKVRFDFWHGELLVAAPILNNNSSHESVGDGIDFSISFAIIPSLARKHWSYRIFMLC